MEEVHEGEKKIEAHQRQTEKRGFKKKDNYSKPQKKKMHGDYGEVLSIRTAGCKLHILQTMTCSRHSRIYIALFGSAPGPLTPGPRSPPLASLVCSFPALCTSTCRVLLRNPMGSAGVGKTTTMPAVRALPDNCNCVHLICCHRPASPSPAWL